MARPDTLLPDSRRRAERHGRRAETWAAAWLRLKGFRVLARRFKSPVGEIDLIVRRGSTVAFVEVKARAAGEAGLDAVTAASRQRIARAASFWLARHPAAAALTLRFDVVVISPWRWPRHVTAAFDGDGRP